MTIFEDLQFLRPGWTDLVEIVIVAFLLAQRRFIEGITLTGMK